MPDTGMKFWSRPDLMALTPQEVRSMSLGERQSFFQGLNETSFLPSELEDNRGVAPTSLMPLDDAVLLHLYRQDPSIAGVVLESNPSTVSSLHGWLTAGSSPQVEEANGLAEAALRGHFAVGEGQSQALAALTAQTMQANGHDPEAMLRLLEAADEGVTDDFGAGATLGSLLAGVRDSGEAPLDFLDKLPGRFTPTGIVTSLVGKALARATDTRDEARANYVDFYSVLLGALDQKDSKDAWRGFAYAGSWNP